MSRKKLDFLLMTTCSYCDKGLSSINSNWYILGVLCRVCGKVFIHGEEHEIDINHPNLREMTGCELGSKNHEDTLYYQIMLDEWYKCEDNSMDSIIEIGINNALYYNSSLVGDYWLRYPR